MAMRFSATACAIALAFSPMALTPVAAQTPASVQMASVAPAQFSTLSPGAIIIPAGTEIEVELVETLNSARNLNEEVFPIRLVAPIMVDGRVVVAAGAMGGGEVIDARPSGFAGRQGRLTVSGRYMEINGARAPIRGMRFGVAGADHTNVATTLMFIAPIGMMFVQGGEVEFPTGLRGIARLTSAVEVRAENLPSEAQAAALAPAPQSPPNVVDASTGGVQQ
jgi:hypothetical protein